MRIGASHGKPIFPTMYERINEDLFQFAGPSSFRFFNIMRLDPRFLSLPLEVWELNTSSNEAKLTDSNLMVVKDSAKKVLSSVMINKQHQAGGCPTEYSAGSREYNYKGSSSIMYILQTILSDF